LSESDIFDFASVPEILLDGEKFIADALEAVELNGKTLMHAANEQSVYLTKCLMKRGEIKKQVKQLEIAVNSVRSMLFRKYTENMNIQLSDRAKEKYIDGDKQYIDISLLYSELSELYDRMDGLCQGFISRGFVIRQVVDIKLNALEDIIL